MSLFRNFWDKGLGLVLITALSVVWDPAAIRAQPVDYDIVYSRIPRQGDDVNVGIPEVLHPITVQPGTDLMLLHPDGSEEVLVPGGNGGIIDPYVSFDGMWVYYSKFHDQRQSALDRQRPGDPSRAGADIYKINLQTREIVRLTYQDWTPNTGLVDFSEDHLSSDQNGRYYLGYGIFNLGACPLPGGKVIFSSSRNSFLPNNDFTAPNFQLYVMDNDGKNVELIGHLNLGSALHPTVLTDGRVMFSSYEAQGARDRRLWALWAIWPDGRRWEPLMSPFTGASVLHFQTELSNRDIAVVEYYNQNNNGFGTLLAFPPAPTDGTPAFGSPTAGDSSNPAVRRGIWWFDDSHPSHKKPRYNRYRFSPKGLYALSAFTHGEDNAASRDLDGNWAGKVTHPSGAPDNDVLLVWSPGPVNLLNRPTNRPVLDAGIYLIPNAEPLNDHKNLVLIKNDPNYNETQPRAVVTYEDIYGIEEPARLPWYQNDGSEHPELPAGTPYGLVGTSSFYHRDTAPGSGRASFDGLDPFNTPGNNAGPNWVTQGADAGLYEDSDIYAVRVLAMEPSTHLGRGPGIGNSRVRGFSNHARERLRILGEVPVRNYDESGDPIIDSNGDPDTSVLVKIPADTPFTFQTIDKEGMTLNMSQTWHQLRPGEVRTNCGGCHAHSKPPVPFEGTAASMLEYVVRDLANTTPLLAKDGGGETVVIESSDRAAEAEYYRDIKPILQRSCVPCHSVNGVQEAGLALDDETVVGGYENTYNRLCNDQDADYGIPPVNRYGKWFGTNASRYVRMFQSRRSLLIWKLYGERLDGWTNSDHPTESVPGDPNTLPAGADDQLADLDFTGTSCPTPGSGVTGLTEDEKMLFVRWIDLGAPIDSPDPVKKVFGWFADDLRPTLDVSLPRSGRNEQAMDKIRLGAFDYYSGLDPSTFSVVADFEINGHAPGTELAPYFIEEGDHIWSMDINPPRARLDTGFLTISVEDERGNITKVERTFCIGEDRIEPSISDVVGIHNQGNLDFQFMLSGEPQENYLIETSDDLSLWNPWKTIQDFDGQQTVVDYSVAMDGKRFYRAKEMEE